MAGIYGLTRVESLFFTNFLLKPSHLLGGEDVSSTFHSTFFEMLSLYEG